jgi:hypothetical protein
MCIPQTTHSALTKWLQPESPVSAMNGGPVNMKTGTYFAMTPTCGLREL